MDDFHALSKFWSRSWMIFKLESSFWVNLGWFYVFGACFWVKLPELGGQSGGNISLVVLWAFGSLFNLWLLYIKSLFLRTDKYYSSKVIRCRVPDLLGYSEYYLPQLKQQNRNKNLVLANRQARKMKFPTWTLLLWYNDFQFRSKKVEFERIC